MDCLEGYKILKRITEDVWLAETTADKFIIKRIPINDFKKELQFGILMSNNNIGPRIYKYLLCDSNFRTVSPSSIIHSGLIIMEKLDGNILELWPFIGQNLRQQITIYIDNLIQQMHNLDIAHGDLHAKNIGYKEEINSIRFVILDYGKSFNISMGKNDLKIIDWLKVGFDWEDSYESFINFEFKNWKTGVNIIPVPTDFPIQNVFNEETINTYLSGDCGILAISLSNKSGWPIYGISLRTNKGEVTVPSHYIVKAPGREFFIDITGIRSYQYLLEYWTDYFMKEGEKDFTISVHKVDNVLCNIDYYNDIVSKINSDDVNRVASMIWDIIENKYNYND